MNRGRDTDPGDGHTSDDDGRRNGANPFSPLLIGDRVAAYPDLVDGSSNGIGIGAAIVNELYAVIPRALTSVTCEASAVTCKSGDF